MLYKMIRPHLFFFILITGLFLSQFTSLAFSEDKIPVEFFYSFGCHECQEIAPHVKERYSDQLDFTEYDVDLLDYFELQLEREEAYGIEISSNLTLFFPHTYVNDKENLFKKIEEAIQSYQPISTQDNQEVQKRSDQETNLQNRFDKISVPIVVSAGLIDGINPCVFSTMIFFVTFLISSKKGFRSIFMIGLGFILATFFTYIAIGLGLMKALHFLSALKGGVTYLTYLFAIIAFTLAFFHLMDLIRYLQNKKASSIQMKLPDRVKKWVNQTIKDKLTDRSLMWGGITLGIIVTLAETICTGQLYLPIIYLMLQKGQEQGTAFFYLILYNVMFILPLIGLFGLVLAGYKAPFLIQLSKKDVVVSKALLFLLFIGLGFLLLLSKNWL